MSTAAVLLEPMSTKPTLPLASQPSQRALGYDRIVLTGFMGSGKSTVGALLAKQLGWNFLDLDTEIERRCGKTVPDLFAELGEAHFRRQEAAALASVLGRSRTVIALGGGAPETLGNRLLLEQTPCTAVIFLQAPFDVLHDRCLRQAQDPAATARPVLADRDAARRRFDARQNHYLRIAPLRLETAELSPAEAADAVLALLGNTRKDARNSRA